MAVGGARRCRLSLHRLWRAWHCSRSCRRVATGPGCALGHSCGPWQATERERSGRCRTLRRKLARHLHDKVGTDVGPRKRCSASGLAESPSFVRTVGCTLGRPVTGREPTRTLLLLLRRCVCCICHPSTPVYSVCCCHCHTIPPKQTRIPVRTLLPHTRCPTSRLRCDRCDRCSPPRAPALLPSPLSLL